MKCTCKYRLCKCAWGVTVTINIPFIRCRLIIAWFSTKINTGTHKCTGEAKYEQRSTIGYDLINKRNRTGVRDDRIRKKNITYILLASNTSIKVHKLKEKKIIEKFKKDKEKKNMTNCSRKCLD